MNNAEQTAIDLLSMGAVFLRPREPFTWASGIRSPIYCDNRLTLGFPEARARIETAIAQKVSEAYPDCEALFGTATAGIAHAAIAAHILGLPMGYVRSSAKDHGRGNQIEGVTEGALTAGMKVVVVEDLISTGGSVLDTVKVLQDAGANVLGVISIFTYGMKKAKRRFAEAHVRLESVTDFDTLIESAARIGAIDAGDLPRLRAFRDNPEDTSWIVS
ncbi:MAG: orotate phosphoribosyltransferase [Oscillospiraceae bacterium]|jgi:orotate phosphoribosyltransferase|nr:orotate phosphoribosyltransferase [Oscillospiraceae bacterium]